MSKYQSVKVEGERVDSHTKVEMSMEQELDLLLGIVPESNCILECTSINKPPAEHALHPHCQLDSQQTPGVKREEQSRSPSETQEWRKKSHHHNLQKHTVTALRDIVKLSCFPDSQHPSAAGQDARELWKQFLAIRGKQVMTKKFLSVLFSREPESVPLLRDYGFGPIYLKMTHPQILQAKVELGKYVVQSLNDETICKHIEKRELRRKEEFKLYLLNFREELESASLRKRISKQVSKGLKLMASQTP